MKTLEIIGWSLAVYGFGLGFVRAAWIAVLATSTVTRDWQPFSRKILRDMEPLWSKRVWRLAIALMVLGVLIASIAMELANRR